MAKRDPRVAWQPRAWHPRILATVEVKSLTSSFVRLLENSSKNQLVQSAHMAIGEAQVTTIRRFGRALALHEHDDEAWGGAFDKMK